jgi:thioredoxin 1
MTADQVGMNGASRYVDRSNPLENEKSDMPLFKKRPKPVSLESYQHLQELVESGKPVFVDFFQNNCQPCRTMDGIVNELAEEFDESAIIVKANVANVPEAIGKFKIRSTPTFVLLTRKPEANTTTIRWRASGLVKKDVLTKSLISAGASPSGR